MSKKFSLLTMNIGNPSLQRVKQQIEWIKNRQESVFVLTETKLSEGCLFLEEHLGESGKTIFDFGRDPEFHVYFPKSRTGDLGVMILSRFPITEVRSCFDEESRFFSRFLDVCIDYDDTKLGIMGLYVPSRDSSEAKVARKKQFVVDLLQYIKHRKEQHREPCIICGDLNVLERDHVPHYSTFLKWEYDFYDRFSHFGFVDSFRLLHPNINEYSWVGRTNDGYRYDHCFVSKDIQDKIVNCSYVHETRKIPLTDHSAMVLELAL